MNMSFYELSFVIESQSNSHILRWILCFQQYQKALENEKREDIGEEILSKLNKVKEQIENERRTHIYKTFEFRFKQSVTNHATNHEWLAIIRCDGENNNYHNYCNNNRRRDTNLLSLRMRTPLHSFNNISNDSKEEKDKYVEDIFQSVTLPFVEQLPRSITWVYTPSNELMADSDSVISKKHLHYDNGEAVAMVSLYQEDELVEETYKKKLEFSEDVDRLIWEAGEEYSLNDGVVQSVISKFLKLDVSDILERYNELNNIKNEGNMSEASEQILFYSFAENIDRSFCRRCLIHSCHMHEEYQPVTNTREDKFEDENVGKECSEHCYLKLRSVTEVDHMVDNIDNSISDKKEKNVVLDTNTESEDYVLTNTNQANSEWTDVEKDLYLQGVKIFGKNSCFITKNLLPEFKTCLEVYNYMREQDQSTMLSEHNETAKTNKKASKEVSRKKHKLVRKKVRLQKNACYPPALRNARKEKNKTYKLYTPCTCDPICGDQCPCLSNGNCCEKFCGCPQNCKNRFGGCNCAKGQCINRQCPCFAANRECDPDLCRSCSLSCGDGSLGETSQTSQCKNMKFLLKIQKRIIIARSDVQGWGAFAKHAVKKNEYLGEYTGELISHEEADERTRADAKLAFSYLFTLNDQLVIDARRKGNKFRFLNDSSTPNCKAKLMIVRGDQRIGLFANKAIEEGEELFFDYCYQEGQTYWSRDRLHNKKSGGPKKDILPNST
ncbi:unnamed protein product [Cochlearia groenlandica]